MKQKNQIKGIVILLLTALIWGLSFVAQSVGSQDLGTFTFGGIRTLMGAISLIPVMLVRDKIAARGMSLDQLEERKLQDKKALKYGIILGLVFFAATNLQQYAFSFNGASAGKIAFITAIYMFFVPLWELIFLKRKVPALTWFCVVCGFIGLYFLCFAPGETTSLGKSDLFSFGCGIAFSIHILLVSQFAGRADGVKLSFVQFTVSGILTCILMLIFEEPQLGAIKSAIVPLLYCGVMSCSVAYTLQIIGQKYADAAVASIIMCTESVFAVLGSALILRDIPTARELVGCCVMFAAIILSQLSDAVSAKLKPQKPTESQPRQP